MGWPLQERFHPEGPISQVPMEWFVTVARILNYIEAVGYGNAQDDGGIDKMADPTQANPWRIRFPDYSGVYASYAHEHDTSTIEATGASTDDNRVMVFADGTDVNATLQTIEALLGEIDDSGTKTAGHVLALTGSAGAWSCNWTKGLLVSDLAGTGSGFVVFDDTLDTFRTQTKVRPTVNLCASTVAADRTVTRYDAGSEVFGTLTQIEDLIGEVPASGTKAAGLALVLTGSAGSWSCNWSTVSGVPSGGTDKMVLQKASNTDYDVEWDWLRAV